MAIHGDLPHQGAHAIAKFEAEGNVDEDEHESPEDGLEGVPLDLLADGGTDAGDALVRELCGRDGLLERFHEGFALVKIGGDLEHLAVGTERFLIDGAGLLKAGGFRGGADRADVDTLGEGKGDGVAAHEVNAVDVLALVGHRTDADRDDDPRGDEGGLRILEKIEIWTL